MEMRERRWTADELAKVGDGERRQACDRMSMQAMPAGTGEGDDGDDDDASCGCWSKAAASCDASSKS